MKKSWVLLCLTMVAVASVASAEIKAGEFSLSPFIGGYTFDGKQHLETMPVFGIRAGYDFTRAIGAEAVVDLGPTAFTKHGGGTDASVYNYRLDALYHFLPETRLVPYLAAGYGGITLSQKGGGSTTKGIFNYGAGLKYFITESMALRGDVRHLLLSKNETLQNYEYTFGLSYFFGRSPAPAPAPMPVVAPEPPPAPKPAPVPKPAPAPAPVVIDSDRDGVPDTLDKCPGTPAGVTVDKDGCPVDADKDGVPDYLDKCPGTPYGVKVDKDGCPLDSDKDGVPDYLDKCPGTPLGVQVDKDGCPLDSDGDGVPDYLDKCPDTPKGTAVDTDGCPLSEKVCITLEVEFDTGKSDIKPKYHSEIARVGDFMKKYPTAKAVIEGHTDNVGGAEYNMKLSQHRAESVRKYLVDKFAIDSTRLTAKGFGLTRPVADNKTAEGRQKNRRIEATIDCIIVKGK